MKYIVKTIKNESEIDSLPKAFIDKYVWGDEYTPTSFAQLGLIKEKGLYLKLTSFEKDPKVTGTEYGHKVHLDSCLEFFTSMDNESQIYVNFEANAAGAFVLTARLNRYDEVRHAHTIDGLELSRVKAIVNEDNWTVEVLFDYDLIEKLFCKKTPLKRDTFSEVTSINAAMKHTPFIMECGRLLDLKTQISTRAHFLANLK